MVFYRKYRPQTLLDLDSTIVREKLYAILARPDAIPHAILFTGPKGLGKTSTARIIAKVVNCIGDKKNRGESGIEPCNVCEQCVSITQGTSMDVLEIDAASNRGIDEIRELKETIKLTPLSAKKKIYIIDEVHMLTTEAFNALLKTLEEPPSHAMFLLCTTEPQKVPPTILSRTFHLSFQKATIDELVRSFRRIIKAENIMITDAGLLRIAQLSDGGFRDGTKALEEVAALANGKEITAELIEEKYHISGFTVQKETILRLLLQKDTGALLSIISEMADEGADIRYMLEQVVSALHTLLLKKAGVMVDLEPGISEDSISLSELKTLLPLLMQAQGEMKYSVLPQLPLELAIIEWGGVTIDVDAISDNISVIGNLQVTPETIISVSTLRKQVGNAQKIKALYGEAEEKKQKAPATPPANVSVLDFSAEGEITTEWLQEFWAAIIQQVKTHNHTLAGVLRGCVIKSFDRHKLILETAYAFHRDKLDNTKTKEVLEQICRELTGNPVSVTVELKAG